MGAGNFRSWYFWDTLASSHHILQCLYRSSEKRSTLFANVLLFTTKWFKVMDVTWIAPVQILVETSLGHWWCKEINWLKLLQILEKVRPYG